VCCAFSIAAADHSIGFNIDAGGTFRASPPIGVKPVTDEHHGFIALAGRFRSFLLMAMSRFLANA